MSCILEFIVGFKEFAIGAASVATALIAFTGLRNWQRELMGRAQFDVARSLVRATYKLRDEIQWCRWPVIANSEFPEGACRERREGKPEELAYAWAHVYIERWKPVQDALREFDAQSLEAEALWGPDIRRKTRELHTCVNELYVAIDTFLRDKRTSGEVFSQDSELAKDVFSQLNSSNLDDENNELSRKIRAVVREIDDEVRPYLRRALFQPHQTKN